MRFADLRKRRGNLAQGGRLPAHLESRMSFLCLSCSGFCWCCRCWCAVHLALRRKKNLRSSTRALSLVRDALGAGNRIRRPHPTVLLLLAIGHVAGGGGRPLAIITLPSQQETIIISLLFSFFFFFLSDKRVCKQLISPCCC